MLRPPFASLGCNLSPRGDGNDLLAHSKHPEQVATYPREGTETPYDGKGTFHDRVATYPREGTETFKFLSSTMRIVVATYPREGTETRR